MDDLISRQAAIEAIEHAKTVRSQDGEIYVAKLNAEMNIQILPSAESEIIRCKECKYAHMTANNECKYCDVWIPGEDIYLDGDYFCASAERKKEPVPDACPIDGSGENEEDV